MVLILKRNPVHSMTEEGESPGMTVDGDSVTGTGGGGTGSDTGDGEADGLGRDGDGEGGAGMSPEEVPPGGISS